ncbi:hypothetical protein RRG08_066745, partial [Elysia crispata]
VDPVSELDTKVSSSRGGDHRPACTRCQSWIPKSRCPVAVITGHRVPDSWIPKSRRPVAVIADPRGPGVRAGCQSPRRPVSSDRRPAWSRCQSWIPKSRRPVAVITDPRGPGVRAGYQTWSRCPELDTKESRSPVAVITEASVYQCQSWIPKSRSPVAVITASVCPVSELDAKGSSSRGGDHRQRVPGIRAGYQSLVVPWR